MKKIAISVIFLIISLNLLSENVSLKRFEVGFIVPNKPKLSFNSEITEEPLGLQTKCFININNLPIYFLYQYISANSRMEINTLILGLSLATKGNIVNVFCDIGLGSSILNINKDDFSSLCFALNSSIGTHINLKHFSISPSVGLTSFANANVVSGFLPYASLNFGYLY